VRIVRVPIYHEGTFRAVVGAAERATGCLRRGGEYWEPLKVGRGFGLYHRVPYDLAWIQDRVEDYEFFFYRRLLQGHYGRDGSFRPRTRLLRAPAGGYRGSGHVEMECR
jgi:hypothetical protein